MLKKKGEKIKPIKKKKRKGKETNLEKFAHASCMASCCTTTKQSMSFIFNTVIKKSLHAD